jgi:hypothetical protein
VSKELEAIAKSEIEPEATEFRGLRYWPFLAPDEVEP